MSFFSGRANRAAGATKGRQESTSAVRLRTFVSLFMAVAVTLPAFARAVVAGPSLAMLTARFVAIGAVAYLLSRVLVAAFSPRVGRGGRAVAVAGRTA